jgi:Uma2 family endonuclease
MAIAVSNLLTTDDYRVLGEGPPHYQLIEGKLLMSPSPNRYHQVVCRNLLLLLGKHLEGNPMGEVYHAPSDVYLTDHDVYQPDLFYVSKANASILTEQGVAGAPDLVVEILSPGSAQMDREVKRKVYLQCGVQELWLVDPDLKSVQVYRANPQGEPQVNTYYVGSSFASPLLPGLTIPVESVFKPPPLG